MSGCRMCGGPITSKDAKWFCSRECANRRQQPTISRGCQECGDMFHVRPHKVAEGKGHFCSRDCYRAAVARQEKPCARCNKPIPETGWHADAKFCSQECYHAHPRLISPISHSRVYNTYFKRQRELCYARDGHKCSSCGTDANLCAHHISPYRVSLSHELGNLITLCSRCHRLADADYQRHECERDQLALIATKE